MRTRRTFIQPLLLQVAGAMVAVATLEAQTVTQGDPNTVDPNSFHSPMVIETIFAAPADPTLWKSDDWTPEKSKPSQIGQFKDKGGKVRVTIAAHVTNPGHIHDKLVALLFPRSSMAMPW